APPLLTGEALQGRTDATLTFWNFCAELESKGMRRAVPISDVMKSLGADGPIAMVGYVFGGGWAEHNHLVLDRFFAATRDARHILANSPEEWQRLAPRIGVSDPAALEVYRRRYLDGVPQRSIADEASDARRLFRVLADIGGTDLVGPAEDLDPGTFYRA